MKHKKKTLMVAGIEFELRLSTMVELEHIEGDTLTRNVLKRETLKQALKDNPKEIKITTKYWGERSDTWFVKFKQTRSGGLIIGCKRFNPEIASQIIKWAKTGVGQQ